MLLILVCWVVLMFLGVGFDEAFSVVVSSIGNVGPGLVIMVLLFMERTTRCSQVDSVIPNVDRPPRNVLRPTVILSQFLEKPIV